MYIMDENCENYQIYLDVKELLGTYNQDKIDAIERILSNDPRDHYINNPMERTKWYTPTGVDYQISKFYSKHGHVHYVTYDEQTKQIEFEKFAITARRINK